MLRNCYIFGIGGFLLGVAAGSLVAAIVSKKRYAKMMDKRIADIQDTNKALMMRRKKSSTEDAPDAADELPENAKEVSVHIKNKEDAGTGASDSSDSRAEFEALKRNDERHYDSLSMAYRSEGDGTFKPALSFPHIISAEEFDEPNGYDKRHVLYYAGDDVAIDTIRGIELDTEEDLGQSFGILTEDAAIDSEDGIIYIRNPRISTDFAVDWTSDSSVTE